MSMPVEEFEEFAHAVTPRLIRSAYLLTGSQESAEDLVQESLIQVYRAGDRVREAASLESYTRTTMYRLQISVWRRRRFATTPIQDLHARHEPGTDHTETTTLRIALRSALSRLSARQRSVVVLRFFEDMSVDDTAQVLGCSPGTVKSQTARALSRLRNEVPQFVDLVEEAAR